MKETPNSLYPYNDDDFIVAYYNNLLECWETESCMDYIQWKDVKRWCVLTDKEGNPVKNMDECKDKVKKVIEKRKEKNR